jgi:hypothetical protein
MTCAQAADFSEASQTRLRCQLGHLTVVSYDCQRIRRANGGGLRTFIGSIRGNRLSALLPTSVTIKANKAKEMSVEGKFMLGLAISNPGASVRELKAFGNGNGTPRTISSWPFVAYLVSIGGALNTTLLIGLALSLSKLEAVVWAFAAAALAGGSVFTVLEMRKLSRLSK